MVDLRWDIFSGGKLDRGEVIIRQTGSIIMDSKVKEFI